MSNRRRLRPQTVPGHVDRFATGYRCPDCHAEKTLTEQAPNVFTLTIAHDSTCPAYRGMTRC